MIRVVQTLEQVTLASGCMTVTACADGGGPNALDTDERATLVVYVTAAGDEGEPATAVLWALARTNVTAKEYTRAPPS